MVARALIAKDKADMRTMQVERELEARALIAKEESAMRDITADREATARATRRRDKKLRQLSAVAKEGRRQQALFIDTMCHEIRNPNQRYPGVRRHSTRSHHLVSSFSFRKMKGCRTTPCWSVWRDCLSALRISKSARTINKSSLTTCWRSQPWNKSRYGS